jgi:hypothetical protein
MSTTTPPLAPGLVGPAFADGRQSSAALEIARGTARLMRAMGYASLTELTLASGRRADIAAVNEAGEIWIAEVKSSLEDFRADHKWADYRAFCDRLSFAVAPGFPRQVLPEDAGLVVADRFGAEVLREAPLTPLPAARRKAVLLRFAREAALRIQTAVDPDSALPDGT